MKESFAKRLSGQSAPDFSPTPPRLADALLELFYNTHQVEEIQSDFHKLFERRLAAHGAKSARRGYWPDGLRFIGPPGGRRISLGRWVFALAVGLVVVITLLSVSRESVRAALQNPARSLRTE